MVAFSLRNQRPWVRTTVLPKKSQKKILIELECWSEIRASLIPSHPPKSIMICCMAHLTKTGSLILSYLHPIQENYGLITKVSRIRLGTPAFCS